MKQAIIAFVIFVVGSYPIAGIAECTENEIHQETVACYNQCISQYFDETQKDQCIQGCVNHQNEERAQCPNIHCTNIGGYNICN